MSLMYRCWTVVDLDALRSNLAWLRHMAGPGVNILTVVKADAYGHGLRQIAATLMQSGTDIFGVANLAEAQAVRAVGSGWPVLMLGPCLPHETDDAVRDGIMPTISCADEARRFASAARKWRKTACVHVKVDTGMGRLGVPPRQAMTLIEQVCALPELRLEGLFTHYASAEDDPERTDYQTRRFEVLLRRVRKAGIGIQHVHAHNSAALLRRRGLRFNLVRPGLLVYGVIPEGGCRIPAAASERFKPALTWKCRVGFLKTVPKGTRLSYGGTYVTLARSRIATLTAGYGDGYPRSASNAAQVLIGGKRCPVVGRITMDQMLADVSAVPEVKVEDEVVLIGSQGEDRISANEAAGWCRTIPWETLTSITYRVPRLYLGASAA